MYYNVKRTSIWPDFLEAVIPNRKKASQNLLEEVEAGCTSFGLSRGIVIYRE